MNHRSVGLIGFVSRKERLRIDGVESPMRIILRIQPEGETTNQTGLPNRYLADLQ